MGFMLVDGNSIGYAAQNAKTLTVNGREVQAIYQFLRMLKHLKTRYKYHQTLMVMWDGRAQFRYDLYPAYKDKRANTVQKAAMKDAYQAQTEDLREMLTALGVTQVMAPRFEADDLAGYFVRKAERVQNASTLLVSGDYDWLQLINKTTAWYDPRKNPGKFCNHLNFQTFTGFETAEKFLEAKCLVGDSSDNISGVRGIGDRSAEAIYKHFADLSAMKAEYDDKGPFAKDRFQSEYSRVRTKLNAACENWEETCAVMERNLTLMDLRSDRFDEAIKADLHIGRGDKDMRKFEEKCIELQFVSIRQALSDWNKVF